MAGSGIAFSCHCNDRSAGAFTACAYEGETPEYKKFTFLLVQKSNKKGHQKSMYSPISGAALLNSCTTVAST